MRISLPLTATKLTLNVHKLKDIKLTLFHGRNEQILDLRKKFKEAQKIFEEKL